MMEDVRVKLNSGLPWQKLHSTRRRIFLPAHWFLSHPHHPLCLRSILIIYSHLSLYLVAAHFPSRFQVITFHTLALLPLHAFNMSHTPLPPSSVILIDIRWRIQATIVLKFQKSPASNYPLNLSYTQITRRDFRLPPRSRWELRCSVLLHSV